MDLEALNRNLAKRNNESMLGLYDALGRIAATETAIAEKRAELAALEARHAADAKQITWRGLSRIIRLRREIAELERA